MQRSLKLMHLNYLMKPFRAMKPEGCNHPRVIHYAERGGRPGRVFSFYKLVRKLENSVCAPTVNALQRRSERRRSASHGRNSNCSSLFELLCNENSAKAELFAKATKKYQAVRIASFFALKSNDGCGLRARVLLRVFGDIIFRKLGGSNFICRGNSAGAGKIMVFI